MKHFHFSFVILFFVVINWFSHSFHCLYCFFNLFKYFVTSLFQLDLNYFFFMRNIDFNNNFFLNATGHPISIVKILISIIVNHIVRKLNSIWYRSDSISRSSGTKNDHVVACSFWEFVIAQVCIRIGRVRHRPFYIPFFFVLACPFYLTTVFWGVAN